VHFYRGELYRSQVWRTRLDTTTNWAVVPTAAMVTFAFGEAAHSHIILLLSSLVIAVFLCQEARRFRYFAPTQAAGMRTLYTRMGVGPIPPWIVLAFGVAFWALIVGALIAVQWRAMPVDEIKGLEHDLAHWKI
jgi:uncharacterized membrane protein